MRNQILLFSVKEKLLCIQNGCFIMFDKVLFRFNHTISEQDLSAGKYCNSYLAYYLYKAKLCCLNERAPWPGRGTGLSCLILKSVQKDYEKFGKEQVQIFQERN